MTTEDNKIIQSDINDISSGSSLNYGTAEYEPDELQTLIEFKNEMHVFGTESIEVFQDIGGTGFVMQRTGEFHNVGCLVRRGVVKTNNGYFFIGQEKNGRPKVYMYSENIVTPVSHPGIDKILEDMTEDQMQTSFGQFFHAHGNPIAAWSLSGVRTTIALNIKNGKWFELKTTVSGADVEWCISTIVNGYGKTYVGDKFTNTVGKFDYDVFSEFGNETKKYFTTNFFHQNNRPFRLQRIELDMEVGVGNSDNDDPVCSMQVSRDGKTFDDPRYRKIGKVGEFFKRVIWRSISGFRKFGTLRFYFSDKVKTAIYGVTIE